MKKVYQQKWNDCMQAVVASLFDLELSDVPAFIEYGHRWVEVWESFWESKGYPGVYLIDLDVAGLTREHLRFIASQDGGVNGLFMGTVKSKLYDDTLHAVVVNSDLDIVHDPDPSEIYLSLSSEDVTGIQTTKGYRYSLDEEGNIFVEKENTHVNH